MTKLKAVVFDMDDTLLSLNLSAFLALYVMDVSSLLGQIARKSTVSMFGTFAKCMLDLNNADRPDDDTRTNEQFFYDTLYERSGIPLTDPVIRDVLETYERTILPRKNDRLIAGKPREGAFEAVETVLNRGYRIALLTNPSFSRACIECRMGWGDMLDMPFELITSWENTTRCKPHETYYRESLDMLGLTPEETLMVGNDPKRDFPAATTGLKTAYVGNGNNDRAIWSGSMVDFAKRFDEVEECFYTSGGSAVADIYSRR